MTSRLKDLRLTRDLVSIRVSQRDCGSCVDRACIDESDSCAGGNLIDEKPSDESRFDSGETCSTDQHSVPVSDRQYGRPHWYAFACVRRDNGVSNLNRGVSTHILTAVQERPRNSNPCQNPPQTCVERHPAHRVQSKNFGSLFIKELPTRLRMRSRISSALSMPSMIP